MELWTRSPVKSTASKTRPRLQRGMPDESSDPSDYLNRHKRTLLDAPNFSQEKEPPPKPVFSRSSKLDGSATRAAIEPGSFAEQRCSGVQGVFKAFYYRW